VNPRLDALARAFAQPVEGPSYRPLTRGLAVLVVAGLLAWAVRVVAAAPPEFTAAHWVATAAFEAVVLWPVPALLFGRTRVDADGVRQLGWLARHAGWAEVRRIRFVRVPMSPRLVVSFDSGRPRIFYSGNAALDAAFERVQSLLTEPLPRR